LSRLPCLVAVEITPNHEFRTLGVGGRESILKVNVPDGYVGFLEELSFNNPSDSEETGFEWWLDNSLYRRILEPYGQNVTLTPPGALPEPKRFDPPIVFKHALDFVGFNNSGIQQVFEVKLGGSFYEKPAS